MCSLQRKGRGIRYQIANICWIIEKAREFQKNISCIFDCAKVFVWITKNCRKFFKKLEFWTTLFASWGTCIQVKKCQLEPDMEQWTGSKLGKASLKAVYCHSDYLIYMQSTSWEIPDWMKHKLESRLPGQISITSDTQMIPPLWQKAKRIKELLDESERGEWKSWLNTKHSKMKIMSSGPTTSSQIDGETVETMTGFIFLHSKITADG